MGARWDDAGVRPNWLNGKEKLANNVIATDSGWVLRRNFTNAYGQSVQRNEVLVSIGKLANTLGTPSISAIFVSNTSGGTTLKRGRRAIIAVAFDEPLKKIVANGPNTYKLAVANTASGNNMNAIANTTIGVANNMLYFQWTPNTAGTYKVQAQTLTNTNIGIRGANSNELINRVISATVSNTLSTFTVSA